MCTYYYCDGNITFIDMLRRNNYNLLKYCCGCSVVKTIQLSKCIFIRKTNVFSNN